MLVTGMCSSSSQATKIVAKIRTIVAKDKMFFFMVLIFELTDGTKLRKKNDFCKPRWAADVPPSDYRLQAVPAWAGALRLRSGTKPARNRTTEVKPPPNWEMAFRLFAEVKKEKIGQFKKKS
jgi:hypothetical protein